MKQYRVARSLFGDLGSLKRNQVLPADDPRIAANDKAFKDLVKRKLLVEEDAEAAAKPTKPKASGKSKEPKEPAGGDPKEPVDGE